jgi:hypothetical protein
MQQWRHWRRITQVLVVWTVLMVAWLVDYASGLGPSGSRLWTIAMSRAVEQIGVIWFVGIIVGSAIWFATRPQPVPPAPPSAVAAPDHTRTIADLAALRDRGAITPEEYEAKKRDLLDRV